MLCEARKASVNLFEELVEKLLADDTSHNISDIAYIACNKKYLIVIL